MDEKTKQRIEELSDRVHAISQLLLSFIIAVEDDFPGTVEGTIMIAQSQADAALAGGRARVTIALEDMFASLREVSGALRPE